ncbi:NB-ARC domain-containing protein [Fusarium sp. Ph1]|nr:NB-ARC domain-containing protein [Fusarium sp. Ph1]
MGWLSRPLRQTSQPDEPGNFVNWLLIFDNVDNLDVLDDYWPKLGRGSVLITSRDPNAKQNMYIHEGLHLPPLTNTETEVLMQKLTHVRADDYQKDALAKIAESLDGLPLVINQMSGLFRSFRLSYMDFLDFLQEEGIEKLYAQQSSSSGKQIAQSLVTYWALNRLSSPAKALLQVMCLLDPDDILEDILIDKSGQVSLIDYPTSRGNYYSARRELLSSSLISQKRNNRLSLHRLVQDATKSMMERAQLVSAFQAAAKLIVSAWPFQSIKEHHSTVRFSKCEDIFPCVLRLKDGLNSILETSPDFPMDISLARLFNDTGWYMFERGLQEETKPFCDLALLIAERLKKTHGSEAIECIRESQQFLGIALVETNEHTLSMAHKQKWLDMLLQRKSDSGAPIEDYELGYAYNEIGVAYGNADMIDEAIEAFVRSIEIFQGLDDYEDTMLGWPEPNLGFMYWLKGDLETAETALVEILDIHAAAWGVDDTHSFKTGKILYGLGNVLESQGRFDESLGFHLRCLEQYKKVLGMNHHRVGDVCHRLASHYMRKGLHKESVEYLATSLRIFKSRSYLAHELARTTFKRSQLHRLMGEDCEADELREKAYKIRKKLKPGDIVPVEKLTEEDFDSLVAFWSR